MAGVNKAIILGNLGNDPEVRYMPNGEPVANLSIATSETWNDKNTGENAKRPSGTASSPTAAPPKSSASTRARAANST